METEDPMSTKHGTKKSTKGGNQGVKGKGRPAGKRVATTTPAPEPIVEEDAPIEATEAATPAEDDAPACETPADATPTPKRKRDMTIEELQAEYLAVVGRPTTSTNRSYLYWKMAQARKGRITVGAIERRAARDKATQQTLPLTLPRETTRLLDAAVAASGARSRSAFIRAALVEKLRTIGGDDATAAADAIQADAAI